MFENVLHYIFLVLVNYYFADTSVYQRWSEVIQVIVKIQRKLILLDLNPFIVCLGAKIWSSLPDNVRHSEYVGFGSYY